MIRATLFDIEALLSEPSFIKACPKGKKPSKKIQRQLLSLLPGTTKPHTSAETPDVTAAVTPIESDGGDGGAEREVELKTL